MVLPRARLLLPAFFTLTFVGCGDDGGTGGVGGALGATSSVSGAKTTSAPASGPGATGTTQAQSGSTTAPSSSSTGGNLSPGCGNASMLVGETENEIDIQGETRRFIVDAPEVIDPQKPLSLVFVFHGNGGNGQASQSMGLQDVPGAQENAIFVFPDGMPFMNFGVGWNGSCTGYDMEFFDTMVDLLSAEFCIDPSRIFAAGFSWGGDMTRSLACCRGDVIRGVAPASGPELHPNLEMCTGTKRPAMRLTYATNDAYSQAAFEESIAWYADAQGCADTTTPIDPDPCLSYDGCTEPVIACKYPGLGHAWPQDWADETWKFFTGLP